MDEADFKEARRQIMQATLELEAKALNYLLVANGAGLAGCLAALKDYPTIPQLHGIGILIVIFASGLVLGTLAFVLFQIGNFDVMHRVLIGDAEPTRSVVYMGFSNLCMKLSGILFVVAVIFIAVKLAKL
jgi:hypothetical protein